MAGIEPAAHGLDDDGNKKQTDGEGEDIEQGDQHDTEEAETLAIQQAGNVVLGNLGADQCYLNHG